MVTTKKPSPRASNIRSSIGCSFGPVPCRTRPQQMHNLDLHQRRANSRALGRRLSASHGICFRDGAPINVIGISYRWSATRACHIDDRKRGFTSLEIVFRRSRIRLTLSSRRCPAYDVYIATPESPLDFLWANPASSVAVAALSQQTRGSEMITEFGSHDWRGRKLQEWLLLLSCYAVTREPSDRSAGLAMAERAHLGRTMEDWSC